MGGKEKLEEEQRRDCGLVGGHAVLGIRLLPSLASRVLSLALSLRYKPCLSKSPIPCTLHIPLFF